MRAREAAGVGSDGEATAYLGEPEGRVLGGGADGAGDKDEHAWPRDLAVDGGDAVLTLLEGERGELLGDASSAEDLVVLEGEHGVLLVERPQRRAVGVERRVVVLDERLRHRVRVHGHRRAAA